MSTDDPDALPSAAGKRIVAPDGSGIVPTSKPQPDGTLVKALARASRWQRMLDQGVYTTVSEIGDAENMPAATQNQIEADLPGAVLGLERGDPNRAQRPRPGEGDGLRYSQVLL